MSSIIPVPVEVAMSLKSPAGGGTIRKYGKYNIVADITTRGGEATIANWYIDDGVDAPVHINDRVAFYAMPRKLLCQVCIDTFETDRESVDLVMEIDDQRWTFPMRARELAPNEVHYQIEIEDEWMTITDAYLSDLLGEEQLLYAERELVGQISLVDPDRQYDEA